MPASNSISKLCTILISLLLFHQSQSRVHEVQLKHEHRTRIPLSTFGYIEGGIFKANITLAGKDGPLKDNQFGFTFDKSITYGASKRIEQEEDTQEAYTRRCVLQDGIEVHKIYKENLLLKKAKEQESMRKKRQSEFDSEIMAGQQFIAGPDNEDRIIFNVNLPRGGGAEPTSTFNLEITKTKNLEAGIEIRNKNLKKVIEFSEIEWHNRKWLASSYPLASEDPSEVQIFITINITNQSQAGIYEFNFQDCIDNKDLKGEANTNIDMTFQSIEKNRHSYLSAGEIPLPEAYFFMFILFAGASFIWFSVVLNNKERAFRLHYLMGALVMVKSFSLLAHAMDYFYISKDGKQHGWAIIFYMMYLIRGVLLFFTLALIATGWSFVKCVLSDKERKVFVIVLPLQVLANVAYIVLESTEESGANYQTWQEIAIFVDLVCCGAIMFPIVWSIRHLSVASTTDGKGVVALKKLRLFRRFYTWTIAYIYLTRIGGLLLEMALPFQLEWLGKIVTETTTFVYFIFTGYLFRPGAEKNPYLQLKQTDDESSNLLDGHGALENVKKRNVGRVIDSDSDDDTDEDDLVDTVALIRAARSPTSVV